MKRSQIDKTIAVLQAEIDERQKLINLLVGAQLKTKKRERKPKLAAVADTAKAG
jgi:hypothetical protein